MNSKNNFAKSIRILFALVVGAYVYYFSLDPYSHQIFHSLNLVIHEAGHTLFMIGGDFLSLAGGTILQLLVPLIFVMYFWSKNQKYSASILLAWFAANFFDVQIYVADAVKMQLPLLGGDNVIHDWNEILFRLNALQYTDQIASFFNIAGIFLLITSVVFAIYFSISKDEKDMQKGLI
ncbi:MAG: hypothetical protein WCP15_00150 [bacterium]